MKKTNFWEKREMNENKKQKENVDIGNEHVQNTWKGYI